MRGDNAMKITWDDVMTWSLMGIALMMTIIVGAGMALWMAAMWIGVFVYAMRWPIVIAGFLYLMMEFVR